VVLSGSNVLFIGTDLLGFDDFVFSGAPSVAGMYTLFDTNALIFGTLDPNDLTGMIGNYNATLSLENSSQDILLTLVQDISAVPEPGTLALALLGLLGLGWFIRKRSAARA